VSKRARSSKLMLGIIDSYVRAARLERPLRQGFRSICAISEISGLEGL
jgi:hypothetical protein